MNFRFILSSFGFPYISHELSHGVFTRLFSRCVMLKLITSLDSIQSFFTINHPIWLRRLFLIIFICTLLFVSGFSLRKTILYSSVLIMPVVFTRRVSRILEVKKILLVILEWISSLRCQLLLFRGFFCSMS